MSTPSPCVGLIGLGLMGSAFARRLLARGMDVVGFDLEPARRDEFARLGGKPAADSAEVLRRCPRVILSLPSHREVGTLLRDHNPHLRPGQIVIDTTTGDPEHAEAMAAELGARGVAYLDATISGNSAQVRDGAAVVMAGGSAEAYAACSDLLAELGGESFHTGGPGSGARMKLATNLVLGLNRAALAEGLAFAEAIGVDPSLALRIMRRSPAYSRAMDVKGEKMLRSDFTPDARLSQHLKDVRIILALGGAAGLPMTLSAAHRAILEQAEAAGLGSLDNSALIQVLRGVAPKEDSR